MQELILEEKTTLSPVMKEIYRRLRTNLEFTGIENKVICLTSCMENDGKSSVCHSIWQRFWQKMTNACCSSMQICEILY